MQDGIITEITQNPELYKEYLNMQADNPTYSPGNIALVIGQGTSETTRFGTLAFWKGLGRNVNDSESKNGMMIYARSTFRKGYDLTPVYDISQTYGKPVKEPPKLIAGSEKMDAALTALLNYAVVPLELNKDIKQPALYDEKELKLSINPNSTEYEVFSALATEIALSRIHGKGRYTDFTREENLLDADSISYILCRRFGIERPQPDASKVAALYDGYDGAERRNALDKIQEMCKQIGGSIERSIEPQQRNRSNNRSAR